MLQQEINEKQKKVKNIVNRWNRVQFRLILVTMSAPLLGLLFSRFARHNTWFTILLACWFLCSICIGLAFDVWFRRNYCRNLTLEEIAALERAPNIEVIESALRKQSAFGTKQTASQILTQYRRMQSKPESELLRASKPTDSDTLLRPATNANETAQEQLLRPCDIEQ
jgi:hypothetical protein